MHCSDSIPEQSDAEILSVTAMKVLRSKLHSFYLWLMEPVEEDAADVEAQEKRQREPMIELWKVIVILLLLIALAITGIVCRDH